MWHHRKGSAVIVLEHSVTEEQYKKRKVNELRALEDFLMLDYLCFFNDSH